RAGRRQAVPDRSCQHRHGGAHRFVHRRRRAAAGDRLPRAGAAGRTGKAGGMMSNARDEILHWAEAGHVRGADLERALSLAGVLPAAQAWRKFIDTVLLWAGVVLVAAGVVFFFAYNWDALGRFTRFGLVQALIVLALGAAWQLG